MSLEGRKLARRPARSAQARGPGGGPPRARPALPPPPGAGAPLAQLGGGRRLDGGFEPPAVHDHLESSRAGGTVPLGQPNDGRSGREGLAGRDVKDQRLGPVDDHARRSGGPPGAVRAQRGHRSTTSRRPFASQPERPSASSAGTPTAGDGPASGGGGGAANPAAQASAASRAARCAGPGPARARAPGSGTKSVERSPARKWGSSTSQRSKGTVVWMPVTTSSSSARASRASAMSRSSATTSSLASRGS